MLCNEGLTEFAYHNFQFFNHLIFICFLLKLVAGFYLFKPKPMISPTMSLATSCSRKEISRTEDMGKIQHLREEYDVASAVGGLGLATCETR